MSRILIVSVLVVSSSLVLGQTPATLSDAEARILELTNAARKKEGLGPLKISTTLLETARAHSKNQARQDKMAHELDGKKPVDRVKAAGYKFRYTAENVAFGEGLSIDEVFDNWMKSPGHRANILKPEFTEIGIGVGSTATGKKYYTQNFGRPLR
jgi:uncharacterized protein YkwD